MTTKTLMRLCAAVEGATGVALFAAPDLVIRMVFGGGFTSDIAVARGAGLAPFVLGLACWPIGNDIPARVIWAQLTYSLLVGLYLVYLRVGGGFAGSLLWPASGLHAVMALLLAGLAYEKYCGKDNSSKSGIA